MFSGEVDMLHPVRIVPMKQESDRINLRAIASLLVSMRIIIDIVVE